MAVNLSEFFNDIGNINVFFDDDDDDTNSNVVKAETDTEENGGENNDSFKESDDYKEFHAANSYNLYDNDTDINENANSIQNMFNLSGRTSAYSYNCFEFLDIDHDDYTDIVDNSEEIQKTIAEGEQILPTFKYLHEDLFMSLYQFEPKILPPERMHIESYMNRNIIANLINTPEYIALRKTCRCDMFNAGVGAEILGKEALKILKKQLKNIKDIKKKKQEFQKLVEKEQEIDSISQEIESLQESLEEETIAGGSQETINDLQNQIGEREMTLQQAREMANSISHDCGELVEQDELTDTLAESISDGLSQSNEMQQAQEDIETNYGYVQAWGLGTGQHTKVPYSLKKSVLEQIRSSNYLKKFTDMIGRYKECAIAEQAKKSKSGAVETTSVTVGNNIKDVLPSDEMNLCNEITKKDFYRRMTQNQLLTYDKESEKNKNKGPIIVCVDMSGSMSGKKEEWAKALTVGVLEIAQLQKREFACIMYDSKVIREEIIHKDEIAPDKVLNIANQSATGGTDFEAPLNEALKLIDDSNFKEADVLFLTDGECDISSSFESKFKQIKEDKEFRVLGVNIGNGSRYYADSLKSFCDSITDIDDITSASIADSDVNKQIFGTL